MTINPEISQRPLAQVPSGQRVRITGYQGGRMLRARLLALGLNLGREVDIIQNNRGLIIIGLNGGRVALGKGISQKILTGPARAEMEQAGGMTEKPEGRGQ
jgi:ferrous iron transport protein A